MSKDISNKTVHKCCQCGEEYNSPINFYKTHSNLYSATKCLPICKDCLKKVFDKYNYKYGSKRKALQRLCMAFDLYYSDTIFDVCDESIDTDTFLGNYIKKLNMVQYQRRTFNTSIEEGFQFSDISLQPKKTEFENKLDEATKEVKIDNSDIEKWGTGFNDIDYDVLNSHYKLLKNTNPNCDNNQEIFIIDLCYTKMQQLKAVREGRVDDYSKLTETYRKSFQQAGLKTVQDDTKNPDDCWSLWTGIISQYTPEEYYKDKKLYADWDSLGEYYERMAIRPLRNLQLGTSDRDKEYYVHESDGDINA